MQFSGWMFDMALDWRDEARKYEERHGIELRTLITVATDLEQRTTKWLNETLNPHEIAARIGYSDRQVTRMIKEGKLPLNECGEARLLDLPVKPGSLPTLLQIKPRMSLSVNGSTGSYNEGARRFNRMRRTGS